MVRLKDIAERVGVSVPAVSKVLNGSKGTAAVSDQAAADIIKAAADMGYERNRAAVALKTGLQGAVGVLIHPMGVPGSELTQSTLEGIAHEMRIHGLRMELGFHRSLDELEAHLERLLPHTVDGLIVAGLQRGYLARKMKERVKAGMPVVRVNNEKWEADVPTVDCTESEVCYVATRHLIERGCRNIVHVACWTFREEGYFRAMKEQGLSCTPKHVYRTSDEDLSSGFGEEAVAAFEKAGIDFDGVVCQCDPYAMGVLEAVLKSGRRVPDDVKIIGVDNAPFCDYASVPLSSVSLELYERGRKSVQLLVAMQKGEKVESIAVPPRLVVRASTGGM